MRASLKTIFIFLVIVVLRPIYGFDVYTSQQTGIHFLFESDNQTNRIVVNFYISATSYSDQNGKLNQQANKLAYLYQSLCSEFETVDIYEPGTLKLFPNQVLNVGLIRLQIFTTQQQRLFKYLINLENKNFKYRAREPLPKSIVLSSRDFLSFTDRPHPSITSESDPASQAGKSVMNAGSDLSIFIYGQFDRLKLLESLPQLKKQEAFSILPNSVNDSVKRVFQQKKDTLRVLLPLPELTATRRLVEIWFKTLLQKYFSNRYPRARVFIDLPWSNGGRYFLLFVTNLKQEKLNRTELSAWLNNACKSKELRNWYYCVYLPALSLEQKDVLNRIHQKFLSWYFMGHPDIYFRVYPPNGFPEQKLLKEADRLIRLFTNTIEQRDD